MVLNTFLSLFMYCHENSQLNQCELRVQRKLLKRLVAWSPKQPLKVSSDKGTEFKGAFKKFCERKGIDTYTTNSEAKSAFPERNIRSLKNTIYKYLENKWSYGYINELQCFVNTINSRINRVTGLAPNKVSAKHVTNLVSQIVE